MLLQESILKTIAYFDLFNFPLTREEIFSYLWQGVDIDFGKVCATLDELISSKKIEYKESFYFLPGREENVVFRNRAAAEGERKLRRARLAAWLIRNIPFLEAVFVCNSVAEETSKPNSDIDFFVVGKPNRLWFVRFFSNLILKIFGIRTGRNSSADKICLSFYVDHDHLNLSGLRIVAEDIYMVYWLRQLYPVYDQKNILKKIHLENSWVRDYILLQETLPGVSRDKNILKKILEYLLSGSLGDRCEKFLKNFQFSKLRPELLKMADLADNRVVIGDTILKFHETDARLSIYERWKINCKKYVE